MQRFGYWCLTCLLALGLIGLTPMQVAANPQPLLATFKLREAPCPQSRFTCITISVPLDHFNPYSDSINVVFGLLKATGVRKGMFVTAVGGPGVSGLLSADSYADAFDPRITENFDVVFFDQRGIGRSGGLQCADAVARYYASDARTQTALQELNAIDSARDFVDDCAWALTQQLGNVEQLRYFGTRQAIEDLEVFRKQMGVDKFWLYGESYGTQFAQLYASTYPQRIAGLVLDGAVDLRIRGPRFYREQTQAFNDVLLQTLQACNADATCAKDFGQNDAVRSYDELAARLNNAPSEVKFPLPNGQIARRLFTFSDLENVAASQLYSESDRAVFLRALAAATSAADAADGSALVPLLRLAYIAIGVDPQTLAAKIDPSYSDAAFYAIECNDYNYFAGTPTERAEKYMRFGDAVEADVPRLHAVFYTDLPCPFWPTTADTTLFDETPMKQLPTLVLSAKADPATPYAQSVRVFARLDNAYLITQQGGPHVVFGRGVSCIDNVVTAFLVDGNTPASKRTTCDGVVVEEHIPLPKARAQDFADLIEALLSTETEITQLPEYVYWDGIGKTSVGCPRGDTLSFDAGKKNTRFTLNDCAFTRGFRLRGTGTYNVEKDRFVLDIAVSGYKSGKLRYARTGNRITVRGIYDGKLVSLNR